MKRLEIFARRDVWADSIEIQIGHRAPDGSIAAGQPLVFSPHPPGSVVPAALSMRTEEAQRLMDELWLAGLRPTEGSGSAGSLAATERHLADMRSIAMGLLKGDM